MVYEKLRELYQRFEASANQCVMLHVSSKRSFTSMDGS